MRASRPGPAASTLRHDMPCARSPVACRIECIAPAAGCKPTRDRIRIRGRCPICGTGGFTLGPPEQVTHLRHIWGCAACSASGETLRAALRQLGVSDDCLGLYGRPKLAPSDAGGLREALGVVLTNPKLRDPAELRMAVATAIWGDAPADYREFLEFARRAGISRSRAYATAARWGRRSAT